MVENKASETSASSPAAEAAKEAEAGAAAEAAAEAADSSMLQLRGVIGSIWDTLFGGAGTGNAENFEGGNQGSYFNFMYPSDNDYPWACVCDEGQYQQWLNKEVISGVYAA